MKFTKEDIELILPVNPYESGLILRASADSTGYSNIETCIIDTKSLSVSKDTLAERINSSNRLKECFIYENLEAPLRIRLKNLNVKVETLDFNEELSQSKLWDIIENTGITFDIQKPPLYKILNIVAPNGDWLIFTYHHILLDGQSIHTLMNSILTGEVHSNDINWIPDVTKSSLPKEKPKEQKFFLQSLIPSPIKPFNRHLYINLENSFSDYISVMAAWIKFIQNASGSDSFCIGEIISLRENSEQSQLSLGYYLQAASLKINLQNEDSNLLDQLKSARRDLNKDSSLNSSDGQLFDHVWVVQPSEAETISETIQYRSRPDYLLSIVIVEQEGKFFAKFVWNLAKIDEDVAKQITQSFSSYLYGAKKQNTIDRQNIKLDPNRRILDLWKTILEKQPNKTAAIQTDGTTFTFKEIDDLSSILAEKLNVGFQEKVGINTSYNADIIISMLACLKKNAVFVPIDQYAYKSKREHIIKNSKLRFIIKDKDTIESIAATPEGKNEAFVNDLTPGEKQSVYIIYTSGSTGIPKGCEVTNANLYNLIKGTREKFLFTDDDTWVLAHSYGFDFSVWEIWASLLNGAKLIIPTREEVRNIFTFAEILNEYKVSILNQTPQAFKSLLEVSKHQPLSCPLRYIIFGGDKFDYTALAEWHQYNPKVKLVNMYGITETTVHVTFKEMVSPERYSNIGSPLPGYQVKLLNESGNEVPDGFLGEAFIHGLGVCKGYFNDSEKTLAVFSFEDNLPRYKSGDYLWKVNGDFFYLGRKDRQIKIRGFRIELSEIEFVLQSAFKVSFVLVYTKNKELIAFHNTDNFSADHSILDEVLPDYAIPTSFVFVKEIPINNNGKVDVPALEQVYEDQSKTFENSEPANDEFKQLLNQVLGNTINYELSFIQNGGDSIKAIRLLNKLKQNKLSISIDHLLGSDSINSLQLQSVQAELSDLDSEIAEYKHLYKDLLGSEPDLIFPVLESQKGMLYESLSNINSTINFEQFVITLDRSYSVSAIVEAYKKTFNLFPTFQCKLIDLEGKYFWVKNHTPEPKVFIEKKSVTEAIDHDINLGFDLFQELIRLTLVERSDSITLILSHHHIISDGWSMAYFLRTLLLCLNGEKITIDFKLDRYAIQEKKQIELNKEQSVSYWDKRIDRVNYTPLINSYRHRNSNTAKQYNTFQVSINKPELFSNKNQTESSIMFSAWLWFLSILFEKDKVYSGLVYSLRANNQTTEVGNLIRSFPFQADINAQERFSEFTERVHKLFLQDYTNLDIPVEDLPNLDILGNHIFVYENYPIDQEIKDFQHLKDFSYTEHTSADWTTIIIPREESFDVRVIAKAALHSSDFISKTLSHFKDYFSQLSDSTLISEAKASLVHEEDRIGNAISFSHTFANFLDASKKQNFAIENHAGKLVSQSNLEVEINSICEQLKETGAIQRCAIGIDVSDTFYFFICIMAVWRVGCVICPVESASPSIRKQAIFNNAEVCLIISEENERLRIDLPEISATRKYPQEASFILHTSGSTGQPKGVIQTKNCLLNLVQWTTDLLDGENGETICLLQLSSFGFDASLHEVLMTYFAQGKLHTLPHEARKDIRRIKESILENNINTIWLPARLINEVLLSDKFFFDQCFSLKNIIVTGEQLIINEEFANLIKKLNLSVFNFYGPTETHVVTNKSITAENVTHMPSIGDPIQNCTVSLRQKNGERSIQGTVGEIWITGANNAIGYINDDNENRFYQAEGFNWYRTGDLGFFNEASELVYLNRKDDQIKVRGQRVELSEIDYHLNRSVTSSDFKTIWLEPEEQLLSFYTGPWVREETIREKLSLLVPSYMIPNHFYHITKGKFPKNTNGKIDKSKLIAIHNNREEGKQGDRSFQPQNKAFQAWSNVLNQKTFPLNSTFQSNGGNSIKLMRLQAFIQKQFGVSLSLKELLTNNTLDRLNSLIQNNNGLSLKVPPSLPLNQMQLSILNHELILSAENINESPYYLMESFQLPDSELNIKKKWTELLNHYDYLTYSLDKTNSWHKATVKEDVLFSPFKKQGLYDDSPYIRLITKPDLIEVHWHHILLDGIGFRQLMYDFLRLLDGKKLLTYNYENLVNPEQAKTSSFYLSNKKNIYFEHLLPNNELKSLENTVYEYSSSIHDFLILALSLANDCEPIGITLLSESASSPWLNSSIQSIRLNLQDHDDMQAGLDKVRHTNYVYHEDPLLYVTNFLDYANDSLDLHSGNRTKVSISKFKYEFQWMLFNDHLKIELIAEAEDGEAPVLFERFKEELHSLISGHRLDPSKRNKEHELTEFNF